MKKIVLALVAFFAALNFALAADANSASKAELEAIKGIGPAIADRIIEERKSGGNFKDMKDLEVRVKGVGEENVKKMAAAGLTVGGGKAAAPKAETKADAKKDAPKAEAKADAKKDAPKAEAKADAKKDAPKADVKAEKKADAKADKKSDKPAAAKDEKKDDKK
jgi:competence protein ComEA